MAKWLVIVLVILLVPVLVLGYLGFVPGLSAIMGANKPRDLGVKYTQADLQSVMAKNGIQDVVLPPSETPKGSLRYEGSKPLKNSFSQSEITARMAENEKVKYNPISDTQVRFNPDGTAEISGRMDLNMVDEGAEAFGMDPQDFEAVKPYLDGFKALNSKPAFYAKGTCTVINNKIQMDVQEAVIGRTSLPLDNVPMDKVVEQFEELMTKVNGLNVKSLDFKDGKMSFDGSVPAKVHSVIKEYGN